MTNLNRTQLESYSGDGRAAHEPLPTAAVTIVGHAIQLKTGLTADRNPQFCERLWHSAA